MAYKVFTNGSTLQASEVNDNLMKQTVAVFSNAAARTAAITTPVEGQLTYLEDVDRYFMWTGSAWVSPFALTRLWTTSFTSVSSVSLPNDTFTDSFDNYKVLINLDTNSSGGALSSVRLRASGTDNSSSNYVFALQSKGSDATTYTGVNGVNQTNIRTGFASNGEVFTTQLEIMNPKKARSTSLYINSNRIVSASIMVQEIGTGAFFGTTSFDSMTFSLSNMTGTLSVYGYGKQ